MVAQSVPQTLSESRSSAPTNWNFLALGIGGLTVTMALAWWVSTWPLQIQSGFKDAAAVITVITLTAVAIERSFEILWTVIDMTAGASWPVPFISGEIKELSAKLDTALSPFCERALVVVAEVAKEKAWTEQKLAEAKKEVEDVRSQVQLIKGLAPRDPRIQEITTSLLQTIGS